MDQSRSCPWLGQSSQLENTRCRLHNELIEFYLYITPSEPEHAARVAAFESLKALLLAKVPEAEVKEFGSFASRLYLPNSDIDIVVVSEAYNAATLMAKCAVEI